jgi:hypothetical protein
MSRDAPRPEQDLAKADLFRELGFGGDPAPYEDALLADGLSNPRKSRIARAKREQVAAALTARFFRVCARGDCQQRASAVAGDRRVTQAAAQSFCEVCGGSVNRAAVDRMVRACTRNHWRRLCIVGGAPATREELRALVNGRLELRFIDGTVGQTLKRAAADTAWADRTVVWGATQLDHKVSTLYRGPTVLTVHRRGIADLADSLERHASGGRSAT